MSRRDYMHALRRLAQQYREAGNVVHAKNLEQAAAEISEELLAEMGLT